MTLSQIIAKDSLYDVRIPVEGHFAIRLEIQNSKIVFMGKEEKIKKTEEIKQK